MNKKVLVIVIAIILVLGGFVIYFKKSDKAVQDFNGMEITHEEATEIIKEADRDNDGYINYEEFVRLIVNK